MQVKISAIEASTVALYFSASWCPPCRKFTPTLVEVYRELTSHDSNSLEVVLVSRDRDEESFNAYFAKMPWLAVPFADSECLERLVKRYKVNGIPNLVILGGETGEIYTKEGVKFINEYGVGVSPFTLERIDELKEQEKAAKENQTIHSVLGTPTRDYLISSKGGKVYLINALVYHLLPFLFFGTITGSMVLFIRCPFLSLRESMLRCSLW